MFALQVLVPIPYLKTELHKTRSVLVNATNPIKVRESKTKL